MVTMIVTHKSFKGHFKCSPSVAHLVALGGSVDHF